ncbi:hypothetical protein UCRPA7_4070 [Phaeoacremonium minimum UCRPA7]|uniref:Uncharacterized protein n=1 Tax=Phaeoacremonium minimum (strain UCR-PA7) TaxID=1286976 RepID=R8BMC7_PHAM7|nr:hypothetical protein UCRPA7_4070 [Phaeoacremonium minimum UCRPA7]EOO00410.1 hypothetical protein UCRPA7_4070 [Phaeoacremonium minimum UCRPA7]
MCHASYEVGICTFCHREKWGKSWRSKCKLAPGCNSFHHQRKEYVVIPSRCYTCWWGWAAAAAEGRDPVVAIFKSKTVPGLVKEVVWM